jgi:2'-5' RNA ligase
MQKAVFSGRTNRLFVGVIPDDKALAALVRSMDTMKQETWARDARWLPKDNIHLTLRFLGDTDKEQYVCLNAALVNHVGKTAGFEINLSKILFFPSASKARVVAVGVSPSPELDNLASVVEKSVVSCGFEPEKRPFKAHITVGRCRDLDLRRVNIRSDFQSINIPVRTVELMKSTLSGAGAVYGVLDTMPLLAC